MSNKYKHNNYIPNSLLAGRLDELADAIVAKMKGNPAPFNSEFTCRIPAEMDRDPDLVISEAAKRLRELPIKDNWISVDDDLPIKDTAIDIWVNNYKDIKGRICNCFYNPKNNKFWYWDQKRTKKIQIYAEYISHWMPIPEPPVSE